MNQKLQEIARMAGSFILRSTQTQHLEKSNAKDFVTIADIKAQNIIERELKTAFPDLAVISEEHTEDERLKLAKPNFTGFVIDPIDGTYNFKREMRESAVSIGYIENGKPQTGVIYDPYKNEMFEATLGEGAMRNGSLIKVSAQATINGASVSTSNSYDDAAMARNLKRHLAIFEQTDIMPWTNCPGSGVLIMANVACGRFDVYHHNGLKPWDNAAAFLLIREAGGKVLSLRGKEADFTSPTVLCGNPILVDELLKIFSKIDQSLLK